MKELLKDEEQFIEMLMMAGPQKLSFLYDKLKRVQSEHKMLFIQILRLKKIIYVKVLLNYNLGCPIDELNSII